MYDTMLSSAHTANKLALRYSLKIPQDVIVHITGVFCLLAFYVALAVQGQLGPGQTTCLSPLGGKGMYHNPTIRHVILIVILCVLGK